LANHTALISRQGVERSIEDSAAPIKDSQGRILGVVMVFHDSTVKRRAEARLLQINRTLKAHNESSQALLTTEDEVAYLQQVCRIVADHCHHAMVWIGFAEQDAAKSVRPVAAAGFEDGYLETLRVTWADTERGRGPTGAAIRTGQPSMCRDVSTDPRMAPWREEALRRGYRSSLVLPLLTDGKALGAISIYSKVTEAFSADEVELLSKLAVDVARGLMTLRSRVAHRLAERALRESEERLKLALGAAFAGAWDWNIRTGTIVWSQENCDLYGLNPADGPPSFADWERNIHPDDLPSTRLAMRDAVERRRPSYQAEFRVRHPRRGERWVLGLGRVEHAADGTPLRMSGINIDITARKEFETELERLVAERTAKSQEMIDELQHVSYSIVHDMRAPLRAMQGMADLLEEECNGCQRTQSLDYFRRIKTASGRMDRLITDALHYTKAVLQEAPVQPISLSPLLRGLVETYPNLHPDGAEICIEGELPTVLGNEALLTQCFSNLLANAVKFVRPGVKPCVRVWAEMMKGTKPRGNGDGEMVRIWVEDNGIGIPKAGQVRLFCMFQRLAVGYEGTGIGLAIVRKVVEHMGGAVGVESEPGKGSRFWVSLRSGSRSGVSDKLNR
jgi:PAS domain S-box-containing protein